MTRESVITIEKPALERLAEYFYDDWKTHADVLEKEILSKYPNYEVSPEDDFMNFDIVVLPLSEKDDLDAEKLQEFDYIRKHMMRAASAYTIINAFIEGNRDDLGEENPYPKDTVDLVKYFYRFARMNYTG